MSVYQPKVDIASLPVPVFPFPVPSPVPPLVVPGLVPVPAAVTPVFSPSFFAGPGVPAGFFVASDFGLGEVSALGFGEAVNITLGLPFIRTSVDHGTALDLAGTGKAEAGSLVVAVQLADELAGRVVA